MKRKPWGGCFIATEDIQMLLRDYSYTAEVDSNEGLRLLPTDDGRLVTHYKYRATW